MSLGKKLLLGFFIPVLMLLASGVWSWARFHTLSNRVQAMLVENDQSVQAAREMTVALERMDSALLLRMIGETATADSLDNDAVATFDSSLNLALNNITIYGEQAILDTIQVYYGEFRGVEAELHNSHRLDAYQQQGMPAFLRTKHAVDRLRRLNHREMYDQALLIADQAYRATLPGTILVVAAILFTLLFAWLLREHTVKPLAKLLHAVKLWPSTGHFRKPDILTGDEIEDLAESLDLVERSFGGRERR
ncbi:MAG: hypothetical protein V2A56_01170 [bacterium]